METKYQILVPGNDGPAYCFEVDWPEEPSLKQLRELVEPIVGGDMDHVNVFWWIKEGKPPEYTDMFVNEHGHELKLPRNEKATEIYRNNWLFHKGGDPEKLKWVPGNAVLFLRKVWH